MKKPKPTEEVEEMLDTPLEELLEVELAPPASDYAKGKAHWVKSGHTTQAWDVMSDRQRRLWNDAALLRGF